MRTVLPPLLAGLLLAGCGSGCNILSSSRSFGCDAALVGGMVLAAPIILPYRMIEEAADRAGRPASAPVQARLDADATDPAPPWAAEPMLPAMAEASAK